MTSRVQMVAAALALGALWFVLCRQLSGEWSVNEQYSYGWFVPFFAAFLFWLRWEDRPAGPAPTEAPSSKLQASSSRGTGAMAVGILALLILFPVRLFEVANPDWRPLGWIHAAAVVALTLVVIWAAGGRPWVRHFAFPVCFILVAVPWITPIEEPIVQGLMRTVAALATETITLFGVPAQVEGNLIRVSTGLVGVNEACSGVRSLQTSLMIGLLFGELKRLSLGKRWLLVIGAIVLALLANFGRALFLIWIAATESVSAVDRWHDIAGYAIVALVFCGSLALAVALAKGERRKTLATAEPVHGEGGEGGNEKEKPETTLPFILPPSAFILSFAWLLAIEIGVEGWYRAHEKQLVDQPGWSVRPPREAPAFREIKIDENVRRTLQFDAGREVVWKNIGEKSPGSATTNYLFFFRWNPGSSSVLRARAHRPDLCLPSVGWTLLADRGPRSYQAASGIQIAARHVVFKGQTNAIAHTFFCLQEDKIHPSEREANEPAAPGLAPAWSIAARFRVVRHGIRNPGQRVLEAVLVSTPPLEDKIAEAQFAKLLRDVIVPVR